MSVITKPTTDEQTTDSSNDKLDEDWWCIEVDEFKAPDPCPHRLNFVSAVMNPHGKNFKYCHLIVVWDKKDNEDLLKIAALSQKRGRNPRIVDYKESFGPWINYDNYKLYGGPSE